MSTARPVSEDDLHAYVDRLLDVARQSEVAAYIEAHPDIARRVEGFVRQRELLRRTLGPVTEEPVPSQLSLPRLIAARPRRQFTAWRVAAAMVLLIAAGAGGGWIARGVTLPPSGGVLALAEEASDSYRVFGTDQARPVEIEAENRQDLVRWISNRLQHPVAVPDLAASGYRFIGGRLVATPHGPAGLLMYDDDKGGRIAMLMRPMESDKEAPMVQHDQGRMAAFAWAQHGVGYSVVGDVAPAILHPVANEIRRQSGSKI